MIEWMAPIMPILHMSANCDFAGFDSVTATNTGLERIVQYFQVVDPSRSSQVAEHYTGCPEISYRNLAELSIPRTFPGVGRARL